MAVSVPASATSREQEQAAAAAEAAVDAVVNNGMWQSGAVEMPAEEASALWRLDATDGDSDEDVEALDPVVIRAEAPLVEGLRTLLVHHLKRSLASETLSLTVSQAELLEHHLGRLVSYAEKIVHTLAFATRFLAPDSKAESEPRGEASEAQDFVCSPRSSTARSQMSQMSQPPQAKHALSLNDDEILSLYRCAQSEAQKEADWRGLAELPASRTTSAASANPVNDPTTIHGADRSAGDKLAMHLLSQAIQSRGSVVASELVDAAPKGLCCGPQRPVTLTVSGTRPGRSPSERQRPVPWYCGVQG